MTEYTERHMAAVLAGIERGGQKDASREGTT